MMKAPVPALRDDEGVERKLVAGVPSLTLAAKMLSVVIVCF
jgi:hypothetical protein